MSDRSSKRQRGFSLMEMMIAMITGTVVLGGAVQIYSQGVNATFGVSQRAEMQQDYRAATNMLKYDLSMAGAGLTNPANIPLPAVSPAPRYGCDQSGTCYLTAPYPKTGGVPYLYGLMPGYQLGPQLTSNPAPTDAITVVYTDSNFLLTCYTATLTSTTVVTFSEPAGGWAANSTCVFPPGITAPQAVNDQNVGLAAGDLVLFSLSNGTQVVAEVTGGISATTASFVTGDVLNMNQAAAVANSLAAQYVVPNPSAKPTAIPPTTGTAQRLLVITYYVGNTVTPTRLMRQISGHTPMPVVDALEYLKFSYDLFNSGTETPAVSCVNPGIAGDVCLSGSSTGLNPTDITKINILHMAIDSTQHGTTGYQGLDLETSVSARNLTFINKYPGP
jgi:prepilin-type N-terminal cleavage/methylation domain-containing protein